MPGCVEAGALSPGHPCVQSCPSQSNHTRVSKGSNTPPTFTQPHLRTTHSLQEGAAGHPQEAGGAGRHHGAAPVHLQVMPQVGLGGEAFVALLTGERLLLGVDAAVADELRGDPERFAAVGTLVAFGLSVDPSVVLE